MIWSSDDDLDDLFLVLRLMLGDQRSLILRFFCVVFSKIFGLFFHFFAFCLSNGPR